MQETRSARREGGGLEERFNSSTPATRHEYLDVHFLTAGVDVVIQHSLNPVAPDAVAYEVVQASAPVDIYQDTSADRRAWTQTEIVLRSNVSNVVVRLLVTTAAGTQQEGIEDMGPTGATYTPAGLVVQGNLQVDADLSAVNLAVSAAATVGTTLDVNGAVDFDSTLDVAGQHTQRSIIDLIGGGIKFPATQVPSADANTLDDYEEGTWTPQLEFGGGTTGITYAARSGQYTKIGNTVAFSCYIELSNKGSSTGVATITGLSFAAGLPSNNIMVMSGSAAPPAFTIRSGTTFLVYQGTLVPADDTHFTNTTFLYFSGVQIM